MTVVVRWQDLPTERFSMVSPVGLYLLDDVTGCDPLGQTTCRLSIEDAAGQWRQTDLQPQRSASGFITFPGLGRARDVTAPPRRYRAAITAQFYRPLYAMTQDGIVFDVFPHNDDNAPAQPPLLIQVVLLPATNYPFPPHLRVLRGQVSDSTRPVKNAEVSRSNDERVLTDEKGFFALPLRRAPNGVPQMIHAEDHRSSKQTDIFVTLPADLAVTQHITIA
jgi:hypothetical protein